MTETTLRDALDGAEYVEFADELPIFVAWHGGTTFNVFSLAPDGGTPVHETDVFTRDDGQMNPPSRATAAEAVGDYLERAEDRISHE